MWQSENINDNIIEEKKREEYRKIVKQAKKNSDSLLYLYIQIMFSLVLIVTAFMLKGGNTSTFEYAKRGYYSLFEGDSYSESNFSYSTYIEKMQAELQSRFEELTEVFNSITPKGSTQDNQANISEEAIIIDKKGVNPVNGYISSGFGRRKDPFNPKKTDYHTGIDIAAPKGTFIRAAFAGQVVSAGYSQSAGNYIKVMTSDNIITLYAHCQFLFVKTGDSVIANQVIATVGQTGYATGPHLHFEYSIDGIKYNPIYVIDI